MQNLEFSLNLETIPVKINGEQYLLVELDGRERDHYLNSLGNRVRIGPNGQPTGMKTFDGLQASLVAASLRKVVDGAREQVDAATVQKWPARVVDALFKEAQRLSALDEKTEEEVGKD